MAKVPDIARLLYDQNYKWTKAASHCPDIPVIPLTTTIMRRHLQQEIISKHRKEATLLTTIRTYEEEIADLQKFLPNQVEVSGLELLVKDDKGVNTVLPDDSSYDSYAVDSLCCVRTGEENQKPNLTTNDSRSRRKLLLRQVSDLSDVTRARSEASLSDESYAENSVSLNQRRLSRNKTPRRSSLDVCNGSEMNEDGFATGNSVKPRSIPLSSYPDYANDSVIVKQPHRVNESDGVGSSDYVQDSMHLLNDVKLPRVLPGKTRQTIKRTTSGGSSFSLEVYESQTINTGGASRAA
jgi:hypothetical protein